MSRSPVTLNKLHRIFDIGATVFKKILRKGQIVVHLYTFENTFCNRGWNDLE